MVGARTPLPDEIAALLDDRGVRGDDDERPAYRRNDYLGWISRATSPETRTRRMRDSSVPVGSGTTGADGRRWFLDSGSPALELRHAITSAARAVAGGRRSAPAHIDAGASAHALGPALDGGTHPPAAPTAE